MVIRAPTATMSGGRWFVGSFEQTLPPIVPRFRTWTSAIVAHTSPRIGRAFASAERMSSVYVVIAPIVSVPSAGELDPAQLGEAVDVDEHVGGRRAGLHDVDQRLAAGERAGAVVRGEQLESLRHGLRLRVLDLAQQHAGDPTASRVNPVLRVAQAPAVAAGPCGDDLREDRHRRLGRRARADVEAGRPGDPLELVVGDASSRRRPRRRSWLRCEPIQPT